MYEERDYFIVDQQAIVKGICTEFISDQEKQWRVVDKLESPPFQRISGYTRNVEYQPSNVRTADTLKKALAYLCDQIFPIVFDSTQKFDDREHATLFLEEKLIAIRCEYFVQGIINPKQLLKLQKCLMIVQIVRGWSSGKKPYIGLEWLVQKQSKQIMENQFNQCYRQALKLSIISSKKKDLQNLLINHEIILEDEELCRLLDLKLKIQANNYYAYYQALETEQVITQCLLWLQIDTMKSHLSAVVKKSFGDVPRKWLFRRLCLNDEGDGWISLKKNPELPSESSGFKNWLNLQEMRKMIM